MPVGASGEQVKTKYSHVCFIRQAHTNPTGVFLRSINQQEYPLTLFLACWAFRFDPQGAAGGSIFGLQFLKLIQFQKNKKRARNHRRV